MTVLEALGGPRERITTTNASTLTGTFTAPVCAAVTFKGTGKPLPLTSGLPDDLFATDGVMTKRPIRALTLSALAPKPGETLSHEGKWTLRNRLTIWRQ